MRPWCAISGLWLTLGQVASAEVICPPGYVDVNNISTVVVNPVYISEFFPHNTVLNINGGITINITDAPTTLVTNALASSILGALEAALLGLTAIPALITETGVLAPNPTATGAAIPSGTNILSQFILQITPLQDLSRRGTNRRQSGNGFISTLGQPQPNCQQSSVFRLTNGELFNAAGAIYSTDSMTAEVFTATANGKSISTTFSIDDAVLTWNNTAFVGGEAEFCRSSTGVVIAVFDGTLPTDCVPVQLGFVPADACPGLDTSSGAPNTGGPFATIYDYIGGSIGATATLTGSGTQQGTVIVQIPTGGPAFTGPYITLREDIGGNPTTVSLAPESPDTTGTVVIEGQGVGVLGDLVVTTTESIGGSVGATATLTGSGVDQETVIIQVPTGGPAFTGPYVTVRENLGGRPTTVSLAPESPDKTGTVVIEGQIGGGFNGPYTTVTSGYFGSVTITSTQSPGFGDVTGTVIIETPLPLFTVKRGYGGLITKTITQTPGPGATRVTVVIETPTRSGFTGPYTTITTGYGGSVTTTVTKPPANGGVTGTVIVETPTTFTGSYTTITSGYGGSVTTTVTRPPGRNGVKGTVIVETPTGNGAFKGPYTTITTGYGGSVTTTVTRGPSAGGTQGTVVVETPTATSPTSCSTFVATATSACATLLPPSCEQITAEIGTALVPTVAQCVTDLGPYAVGTVANCLNINIIATTQGTTITDCLEATLDNQCITALPPACNFVDTETGTALLADVTPCKTALGPFAFGAAANCLLSSAITTVTTGAALKVCLVDALAIETTTTTTVCGQGTTACVKTLPPVCQEIGTIDGLLLVPIIPVCVAALGTVGPLLSTTCLTVNTITSATLGGDILTCLENLVCN